MLISVAFWKCLLLFDKLLYHGLCCKLNVNSMFLSIAQPMVSADLLGLVGAGTGKPPPPPSCVASALYSLLCNVQLVLCVVQCSTGALCCARLPAVQVALSVLYIV